MTTENRFKYDMLAASKLIKNQYIKNRTGLFIFCRNFGIIADDLPVAQFVAMGYFTVEFKSVLLKGRVKTYPKILVSDAGIKFINKLASVIFNVK
jgi:hypothetical protein